jgi:hypothetical protein
VDKVMKDTTGEPLRASFKLSAGTGRAPGLLCLRSRQFSFHAWSIDMSTRLKVRLAIAAIALVVLLIVRMVNPTRVTFSPANMSIDPGKGWKELKVPALPPACSPRLVSKAGMINALLLDEEVTDIKAAAGRLQSSLINAGKAAADGFKQENFTTASGLAGIHFFYTGKSSTSDTPIRSHHFVTHNMLGRCVSISYMTSPELESAEVIESITRTLRVE